VYGSRRRFEETGLRWAWRRGFPPGQLQQPKQPRILRPQPRELVGQLSGSLTPNVTSAHIDHRTGARYHFEAVVHEQRRLAVNPVARLVAKPSDHVAKRSCVHLHQ